MTKQSPIVPPTTVQFTESITRADDLETVVVRSTEEDGKKELDAEEICKNMEYVAGGVGDALSKYWSNSSQISTNFSSDVKRLLPYVASLTLNDTANKDHVLSLPLISGKALKGILEGAFGKEIQQAGIYEALGIKDEEKIDTSKLTGYFPEFKNIHSYTGKLFNQPHGVSTILLISPEVRPFFAGILRSVDALKKGSVPLEQLFGTRDALAYAKQVNQLSQVAYYLEQLNQGEKK